MKNLLVITFLAFASVGNAKEPSQAVSWKGPKIEQFQKLIRIDPEQVAIRSVVNYYGAAIYRYRKPYSVIVLDEATLPALWTAEKAVFGEEKAGKNFECVEVFSLPCIPELSSLYARIFVDMFTYMQKFIIDNSWNVSQFCTYWSKFYHAGGGVKKMKKKWQESDEDFAKRKNEQRKKNNEQYAKETKKIWRHELKKKKRGYWDDPITLSWDDQMVAFHSLLYASEISFIKTVRRKEGGRHGKEMGHESPNNYEVFGNGCGPERAWQYGKGSRSYNIALQNFVLKNSWWRKTFIKKYTKYRGMSAKQQEKFLKVFLEERHRRLEMIKAKLNIHGYDPSVFESATNIEKEESK